MVVSYLQSDIAPSLPASGTWLLTCNWRLVAAVCASLLLHGLMLTSYDQRTSANGELPKETSSRRLRVTLDPPLSAEVTPEQEHAESTQGSRVAREHKGSRVRKHILPDLRKQAFDATGNAQAMA